MKTYPGFLGTCSLHKRTELNLSHAVYRCTHARTHAHTHTQSERCTWVAIDGSVIIQVFLTLGERHACSLFQYSLCFRWPHSNAGQQEGDHHLQDNRPKGGESSRFRISSPDYTLHAVITQVTTVTNIQYTCSRFQKKSMLHRLYSHLHQVMNTPFTDDDYTATKMM